MVETYSVLDLCEIFNINPNSFPAFAKRLGLNKESQILKNDYKAKKRYYNQKAFEMIVNYFKKKNKPNYNKDSILLDYVEKIKRLEEKCNYYNSKLENTNEKYKNILDKKSNNEISLKEKIKSLEMQIKKLENDNFNLIQKLENKNFEIDKLKDQNLFEYFKERKRRKENNG